MNLPLTQEETLQYLSVFVIECFKTFAFIRLLLSFFFFFRQYFHYHTYFYVKKFPDFKNLPDLFFHFLLDQET